MPSSDREQELLRLLDLYIEHLRQSQDVDPSTVGAYDALDAAVQR